MCIDDGTDKIICYVQHHPLRPQHCLDRTVRALLRSTKRHLEVVVIPCDKDEGIGRGHARSVELFLKTDAAWYVRVDDDIEVPPGCWDRLIEHIEHAHRYYWNVACAFSRVQNTSPKIFEYDKGARTLRTVRGVHGAYKDHYAVCDFVGQGCTIVPRRAFKEQNIVPCGQYQIGGVDVDLAWHWCQAGYVSLFCYEPVSNHFHAECREAEYERIRYDAAEIRRSGQLFEERWGLSYPQLSHYGEE